MAEVRVEAPAKVNLRLRVMAQEASGYHQLETVFQALEFGDHVGIEPRSSGVELLLEGPAPCVATDNLAYRAATLYLDRAGIRQGVSVRLTKVLPAGGGLGGGSSDAAAVLKALELLYESELGHEAVAEIARQLGADVPFFLSDSPLALAWGRGDRFLPLSPLPAAAVLLCLPGVSVATPEAFAALARHRRDHPNPAPAGALGPRSLADWQGVTRLAVNDFHEPVFQLRPDLERLHGALLRTSPRFGLMSGSGAGLFAVYETHVDRDNAADVLAALHPEVRFVPTTTRTTMPDVTGGPGRSF